MKLFLALSACFLSHAALSYTVNSTFEDIPTEFCADKNIDYKKDVLYCKASNSAAVIKAKIGKELTTVELKSLKFSTHNATELEIVADADSSTVFFYTRWLLDLNGKKVGVITIEGWTNSEMETSARFNVRYNLKGEIVMATTQPIR